MDLTRAGSDVADPPPQRSPHVEVAVAGIPPSGTSDGTLHSVGCLASRIAQLEAEEACEPAHPALEEAKRLLRQPRLCWLDPLRIEPLVLCAMSREAAEIELGRRLVERHLLPRHVAAFYDDAAATLAGGDPEARASLDVRRLLVRLVEDLNAASVTTEEARRHVVRLRQRKVWCFLLAFVLFLASSALFVYASVKAAETGDVMPIWLWWLKAVADPIVAVCAGLFGAAFSMLRHREAELRTSPTEALERAAGWSDLCARLWAGVGGAIVLYYVLLTGFLDVPMLDTQVMRDALTVKGPPGTVANHAALTVLCFVAGFSERLVPSVIERVAGRIGGGPGASSA